MLVRQQRQRGLLTRFRLLRYRNAIFRVFNPPSYRSVRVKHPVLTTRKTNNLPLPKRLKQGRAISRYIKLPNSRHRLTLETGYWRALAIIAKTQQIGVSDLIADILRQNNQLLASQAVRLFLEEYVIRANEEIGRTERLEAA